MKKVILSSMGLLFVLAILMGGCTKPEEKKAEAPPETKQTMEQPAPAVEQPAPAVQEQAAEMKEEPAEKTEPTGEAAGEKAPATEEQAASSAKEIDVGGDATLEQLK